MVVFQRMLNHRTTNLHPPALLSWQWARTAGPQTQEETVIFFLTSIHSFVNGIRYLQVGEHKASTALMIPSALSLIAFGLQRR